MKFLHTIAAALAGILAVGTLGSCKDDPKGPDYPDEFQFKQELRVEQWNNGTTNAFANFIAYQGMDEVKLQLPSKSSITADGKKLSYEKADNADPYSFSYSAILNGTPNSVTFTFKRTEKEIFVNTISLADVPMVRLPAGNTVENNKNYTYTPSLQNSNAQIRIFLMRTVNDSDAGKTYNATLFGNQYYFTGVPAGTYLLRSMATVTINSLQESNGTAGGSLTACKVYELGSVTVK